MPDEKLKEAFDHMIERIQIIQKKDKKIAELEAELSRLKGQMMGETDLYCKLRDLVNIAEHLRGAERRDKILGVAKALAGKIPRQEGEKKYSIKQIIDFIKFVEIAGGLDNIKECLDKAKEQRHERD